MNLRFLQDQRIVVLILFFLALVVRLVWMLYLMPPLQKIQGWDQDDWAYVKATSFFITWIKQGRLEITPELQFNMGHPMLAKMLFAVGVYCLKTYVGGMVAAKIVSAVIGSVGTIATYFLGRLVFRRSSSAFGLAVSVSFSSAFFEATTRALLDGISVTFLVISLVFLLRCRLTRVVEKNLILSGLFLGLGLASKLMAVIGAIVNSCYIAVNGRLHPSRRFASIVVLGIVAASIFILVQPRMWIDPVTRLYETVGSDAGHLARGHLIPVSSLPGGDHLWRGSRTSPPPWTILYWIVSTASPFTLIAMVLACLSFRKISSEMKNPVVRISLTSFLIPAIFLSIQTVKLPQYLTFVVPGMALVALLGYNARLNRMNRLVIPLSMTTILDPIEQAILGYYVFLYPIWLRFLQWGLMLLIIACVIFFGKFESSMWVHGSLKPVKYPKNEPQK